MANFPGFSGGFAVSSHSLVNRPFLAGTQEKCPEDWRRFVDIGQLGHKRLEFLSCLQIRGISKILPVTPENQVSDVIGGIVKTPQESRLEEKVFR